MWIFTRHGFISAVHKPQDDPLNSMVVRARTKQHLTQVLITGRLLHIEVIETLDADYRFRAFLTREEWSELSSRLALDVDYGNFKGSVTDSDYLHSLHAIWHEMHDYQQRNLSLSDGTTIREFFDNGPSPFDVEPSGKLRKTKRQTKLTVTKPKRKRK